ncbi:GntR family transcriptional regulator [Halomonas sp. ML-15]|uniref:GntR family transcriptional regulator n=1 Tax=Halomonas sp. ML-15 TaxID=2773305 RepID=UPI00174783DC|nr:GntR family transcriptional regulator [Halomonas sp. ML-15]MBD3896355.1 GntR family transcriptional regulator [Halomonas sp. ML-15]
MATSTPDYGTEPLEVAGPEHPEWGAELAPRRPIARKTLHDSIVESLRDMIISGQFPPGAKLPEKELCEYFGVSRTPLRESFKVLAAENIVELLPSRGVRVTQTTVEDIDEIFEVLGVLEALSGELACLRMSDAEIADIRELHERMVEHYERGERMPYFKINQEIHERIMAGAGNRNLADVYSRLTGRIRRSRYLSSLSDRRWKQAVGEHAAMLNALESRDGERLFRILREHLKNKADAARTTLLEAESHSPSKGSSES